MKLSLPDGTATLTWFQSTQEVNNGSLGIAPTRNCITFLKLDSWSPGVFFLSYYIHQGNKSDKERKIVRKNVKFCAYKKI